MDQIDAIIADFSTFLIHLVASSFLLDISAGLRDILNILGVWLVRCAIFLNVVVSMCRTVGLVVGLVKAYSDRMKLIQAKYTPNITTNTEERAAEIQASRNPTNWLGV